jgi:hypothetical protein
MACAPLSDDVWGRVCDFLAIEEHPWVASVCACMARNLRARRRGVDCWTSTLPREIQNHTFHGDLRHIARVLTFLVAENRIGAASPYSVCGVTLKHCTVAALAMRHAHAARMAHKVWALDSMCEEYYVENIGPFHPWMIGSMDPDWHHAARTPVFPPGNSPCGESNEYYECASTPGRWCNHDVCMPASVVEFLRRQLNGEFDEESE